MSQRWDETTFVERLSTFQVRPDPKSARALAEQGDERALPALIQCMLNHMEGPAGFDYVEAVEALAQVDVLQRWLTDGVEKRRLAAHALTARLEAHVPLLRRALWDSDDQVRAIARRKLVSFVRSGPLHDLFVDALSHGDPRVRVLAAEGLSKIGKREDLLILRGAMQEEGDVRVQHALDQALSALGG